MVEEGRRVSIRYIGSLDDGSVFDSTEGKEPFSFVVGSGGVIAGLSDAVRTMEVGQVREVVIPPEQGFGVYDEGNIAEVPLMSLPNPNEYEVGKRVYLARDGLVVSTKLLKIEGGMGYFDFNAPLAGETLHFTIKLLEAE